MLKSELIRKVAAKLPLLNIRDIDVSINQVLDTIAGALCVGKRVEIRGFGCFTVRYRKPRNAHNPKTGKKLVTAPKYKPHFKVGKKLRDCVDLNRINTIKE